jgi:DNA-binding transcriptional ArsR family regulator
MKVRSTTSPVRASHYGSPQALDRVFSALSDTTRRGILERLRDRESTVSELAQPVAMSLPAVSKHLRVLEGAGLLLRRVDGRTHFLKANPEPLSQAAEWIERHRRFWEGSFDRLAKLLEEPIPEPKLKPKKTKPT